MLKNAATKMLNEQLFRNQATKQMRGLHRRPHRTQQLGQKSNDDKDIVDGRRGASAVRFHRRSTHHGLPCTHRVC